MSKLARLIAQKEGFGKPNSQPTRKNNPGDLRHSPHSSHEGEGPNDIGIIDTPEHGWLDLERQLHMYAERNFTIQQLVYAYAPEAENDSAQYLSFICEHLPCDPETTVASALEIE